MDLVDIELQYVNVGDYISIDGGERCRVRSFGERSDTHTTITVEYADGLKSMQLPLNKIVQRYPEQHG